MTLSPLRAPTAPLAPASPAPEAGDQGFATLVDAPPPAIPSADTAPPAPAADPLRDAQGGQLPDQAIDPETTLQLLAPTPPPPLLAGLAEGQPGIPLQSKADAAMPFAPDVLAIPGPTDRGAAAVGSADPGFAGPVSAGRGDSHRSQETAGAAPPGATTAILPDTPLALPATLPERPGAAEAATPDGTAEAAIGQALSGSAKDRPAGTAPRTPLPLSPAPERRQIDPPAAAVAPATKNIPDDPAESLVEDGAPSAGPLSLSGTSGPLPQIAAPVQPPLPVGPAPTLTPTTPPPGVPANLPANLPADIAALVSARPDGPVELRLSPEELGRLHLHLLSDGDTLRVTVLVERPETLDLLRRHADLLIHEIRAAGFAGGSFTFAGWGGGQAGGNAEGAPAPAIRPDLPEGGFHNPAITGSGCAAAPATGLDLRL
jgi:hypothetical protein